MKFFSIDNFIAVVATAGVSLMSIKAGFEVNPVEMVTLYGVFMLFRKNNSDD